MKRFIAIIMSIMMLATLAVSTSAAGEILFEDTFSNGFLPANWILEGNLFFLDDVTDASNPCIAAYADGVVCQMEYHSELTASPKSFTNCVMSVNVQVRDFDRDGDHKVGLWWRDDFSYEDGVEIGEVYTVFYSVDNMELELWVDGVEDPLQVVPVAGGEVGGDWFNLGWRIVPGNISCYVDGVKVIDYSSTDIAAVYPSPILLWNLNCFSAWDDVVVASADYDMFGEGLGENVNPDVSDEPIATEPGADVDPDATNADPDNTDAEPVGSDNAPAVSGDDAPVASDNTPADSNAPAASNNAGNNGTAATNQQRPQGGNSATTGDTAFVVVAVMVATLGCAIVVKKVSAR